MTVSKILGDAESHQKQGRFAEAEACYRQAIAVDVQNADAHYGLGTLFVQRHKFTDALPHLEKAVALESNVPEFLFNLAIAEKNGGLIARAKKTLEKAANVAQGDTFYLLPICKLLLEVGEGWLAFSHLRNCGEKSAEISLWTARAQGTVGDWGGALQRLTQMAADFPDNSDIWREHSKAAAYLRDYDNAIKSYEIYLHLAGENASNLLALADLYLTARKPAKASEALEKSFNLGADIAEAYLIAAKCARLEGDQTALETNLSHALARRPSYGQAWQMLFESAGERALPDLAASCEGFAAADTGSTPEWDKVMLGLTAGRAYEKLGQYEKAFNAFAQANALQKTRLASKANAYHKDAVSKNNAKIFSCFPKNGDFPIATSLAGLAPKKKLQRKPVFILGMPRSGTTLVEKIIACLDGVEAGGENEAIEFVAGQYYWDYARGKVAEPQQLDDATLMRMADDYWRRTPIVASVVTDKMPHNFRHIGLICQIFPEAPILYMKRDPRDVCLSIFSRLFPDGHRYACDLDWLAHFYAESEHLKNHWKETFPGRILEVNYEGLVEDPISVTQAITAHCGLEWHPECLDFHKQQKSSFTFSELQVRKPLNRDGIGRWHHYANALKPLEEALEKYGAL